MKQLTTKIGDHYISILCHYQKLNRFFERSFPVFLSNKDQQTDLTINIKDGYGEPFKDYKVEITKLNQKILYQRADYLIEVDSEYKVANISSHDELALKHALTNLYSAFIVHHQWGLLIHSSCAIDKGKAHIFSGHSGAGKSTAARLSYPRELLSDEATLVKITPNGVHVFNSPFRSEMEAEKFEGEVELASIELLIQAIQNKRVRLEMSDAILQLMDKVFFWPQSNEEMKTIMRLMTMLVKQVPVYELHFQKNNTFWELIS